MSAPEIIDYIGRPIEDDAIVFIIGTSETGRVIGRTAGRKNMVDVERGDGSVTAFNGPDLFLRKPTS
jgi:hypothetical protein